MAIALRMAQALSRTQSPLALSYRRIRSRIGGLGAVTATAHKLARLVCRMLKYGREYVKQSMQVYENKIKANLERSLRRKAAALGYDLVAKAQVVPTSRQELPMAQVRCPYCHQYIDRAAFPARGPDVI